MIENLSSLVNLEALYVVHNQLRTIENLSALVNLRVLELGDNRIKVSFFVKIIILSFISYDVFFPEN